MHSDWRDTRQAIQAPDKAIEEDHPGSIPQRDRRFAEALRDATGVQHELTCVECNGRLLFRD